MSSSENTLYPLIYNQMKCLVILLIADLTSHHEVRKSTFYHLKNNKYFSFRNIEVIKTYYSTKFGIFGWSFYEKDFYEKELIFFSLLSFWKYVYEYTDVIWNCFESVWNRLSNFFSKYVLKKFTVVKLLIKVNLFVYRYTNNLRGVYWTC